jgi:hypothetical protein
MKEIRILLTDEDFAKLCQTGFVLYNNIEKIKISEEDFDKLIEGKIVSIEWMRRTRHKTNEPHTVKVALQDIGYDRIAKHLMSSPIY